MAINEQVDAYLRDLYERSISPPDAMPGEEAVEPFTYGTAGAERPRFDRTLAPGGVVIEDEGGPVVRPYSESGFAQRDRAAAMAQPIASEQPSEAASYLSALRLAQRQDELAAMAARTMAPAEEIARIQSRGLYRPSGVPELPSATEQLFQRQKAVQEMLAAKRGERVEARQERAAEQEAQLNQVQIARQNALMEADKLRLAMEQGESPYKVMELQANVRKALAQAQLAEETARAKGRPVVVMPRPAKEPKALPSEKPATRPLPATETRELADFAVAENELDALLGSFKERNMAGAGAGMAAKGAEVLGMKGTESAAYLADARRAMQAVGTILEGGKLAAGDEMKYRKMLPEPGDSLANAERKVEGLKKYLRQLRETRAQAFRAGGFQVGGQPEQAPQAPRGVAPSKEDLARAAVSAFKAAQASGADAATLERLRDEATKAVNAVKVTGG
jgi:hypothetical protein